MMRLAPLFTDHMVLAAEKEIRIFGSGKGTVKISFCGFDVEKLSCEEEWHLTIPALPCGGPYDMHIELGNEVIDLHDVYIGRVYLIAGQSNAQFKMCEEKTPPKEYRENSLIRSFFLERLEEGERFHPSDGWVSCTFETIPNWSALGYLCSEEIAAELECAVGVICCYQGASGILSWLPPNTNTVLSFEKLNEQYRDPLYSRWNGAGVLYRSMFKKLVPYGLSGIVWYQGESDTATEEGEYYGGWLRALVEHWREDLLDPDLFFAIIQIADFDDAKHNPGWKLIQEAQAQSVERLPHTKLVISRDVCDSADIHPASKRLLAQRIAQCLLDIEKTENP